MHEYNIASIISHYYFLLATPQAEMLATAVATPMLPQNVPGLPDFLANRQPIASAGVEIFGGSNIADLEGSLGHEDLMEAKAHVAMRWMLQHPKLCYMAHASSAEQNPNNMYA